jgi:hypothetical protein
MTSFVKMMGTKQKLILKKRRIRLKAQNLLTELKERTAIGQIIS